MQAFQELYNPELLQSVKGLQLLSKLIQEESAMGLSSSIRVGAGVEFSQFRSYEQGDDLRFLDWKMYGRSERYYIRLSEIESHLNTYIILDGSASMLYEENKIKKYDYARILAAALINISIDQGDKVGLMLNQSPISFLNSKDGPKYKLQLMHQLVQKQAMGAWQNIEPDKFFSTGKKSLFVIISDLYNHHSEIIDFCKKIKTNRSEVLFFHLSGERERAFNFKSASALQDLETGTTIPFNRNKDAGKFSEVLLEQEAAMVEQLKHNRIAYAHCDLSQSPGQYIHNFLSSRHSLY